MVQILPSILAADFAHLADDIAKVEQAGATMLHIDIMDGHFVPNLTFGPPLVASIRKSSKMIFDVHLMIEDPDTFAPLFIEAGGNQCSVHYEACRHLDRTIRLIQSLGAKAGVVINPATPVWALEDVLEIVDYVLVMSVNPGFGGQKFIRNSLNKIEQLDIIRRDRRLDFKIEIDGGVCASNTSEIVEAGCDWLVAGSSVFHSDDPGSTVKELQQIANSATSVKV